MPYLIPGFEIAHAPAVCNQVDALGGILGPHNLSRAAGANEGCQLLTSCLVCRCGFACQVMYPPVHIGVALLIVLLHGLKYLQEYLGSAGLSCMIGCDVWKVSHGHWVAADAMCSTCTCTRGSMEKLPATVLE